MKNYTFDDIKEKTFICYYEKTEENLIVHHADGSTDEIPNTNHNERNILNRMKLQIENAIGYRDYNKKLLRFNSIIGVSAVTFISLQTYLNNIGEQTMPNDISILIALVASAMVSYGIKETIENIQDYDKNKMYLDNEEDINKTIEDDININDVQFMKYNDVKKLVKSVKN